jgi:urea transport system permease protein
MQALPIAVITTAAARRLTAAAVFTLLSLAGACAHAALDPAALRDLAADDSDVKIAAIRKLSAGGDPGAAAVLQALGEDALYTVGKGESLRIAFESGGRLVDAASGTPIEAAADKEAIVINNRIRGALDDALGGLRLSSPDRAVRLAAARQLQGAAGEQLLPVIERALAGEADPEVKALLIDAQSSIALGSLDPKVRLRAVQALAASDSPQVRQTLATMITPQRDGSFPEADAAVRAAAQASLAEIGARVRKYELAASLFSGVSLGSVLLLAALGLAITYGLMGIINMAHGEFLMIGAYATYAVQNLFRSAAPGLFDWYVLAAIPVAFLAAAAVGMLLERGVLRWLYGRPLETLLTTWGVSLLLIQSCRSVFGPQNVEVENPSWLSGGWLLPGGAVIPYNRIIIIGFALTVLLLVWLLLNRTRLGLFVRGVTQNRAMAACAGVPTHRVDMLTFGLGSGVAGLGGLALSQIGNVGPDLGQGYIVDSFMVVVLGGVGQLAGTVIAALGLGATAKFLEPFSGAVLAKIAVLVGIILFIQKRPQGLFALKGRSAET